jgi:arabinose-5-phosphate isomerase
MEADENLSGRYLMNIKEEIAKVIEAEADALKLLQGRVGNEFEKAVALIRKCRGKLVVIGLGKSGLIGQKISATFSSTGTPAVYLHPVEAAHGDIGIIMKNDVVILISQSGETEEVTDILPALSRLKVPLIAITGKIKSTLGRKSAVVLDSSVAREACPMGLAPTSSTTVQLAIGDALAVVLLKAKGFKKEDFARLHPGGTLGKKLALKVKDVMHSGEAVPAAGENVKLRDGLLEMTRKRFGCTAVVNKKGVMTGIFTDGDLRRLLEKSVNPYSEKMKDVMTRNPVVTSENELAIDALALMQEKKITVLMVPAGNGRLRGVVHLHDIIKLGLV